MFGQPTSKFNPSFSTLSGADAAVRRRSCALASAALLLAMLSPAPLQAQGLPISLKFDAGQLFSLSTSADLATVPTSLLKETLPIDPNITVTLTLDLPSGYPLTGPSCPPGVNLVSLGNLQYGVSLNAGLPTSDVLSCTLDTLNALQSAVGTIVPLLARQNDFLMSLDVGLERQIDAFIKCVHGLLAFMSKAKSK